MGPKAKISHSFTFMGHKSTYFKLLSKHTSLVEDPAFVTGESNCL